VGFKENLPAKLVTKINKVEHDTAHNQHKLTLNICFNYGGMQDILQAAKLVKKQTTLAQFEKMLLTKNTPAVDLLIRTGNEKRISNFLLFQSAYAEIIFESTF
jgi:undecaprenyl diphosphate synthase